MIISVINMSDRDLDDAELQAGIRAVNRQLTYDFAPYWGFGAQLRLEGKTGRKQGFDQADMRGDAVLYVRKKRGDDDDGFHTTHFGGIPYGFGYLDIAETLDKDWTVTLSHEALELVGDPELNLLVRGPHPTKDRTVFHWFEMCDAVQSETYEIDGKNVSNFVLPLYFTDGHERGSRNDFGGYINFFDPKLEDGGADDEFAHPDDKVAEKRLAMKRSIGVGRGHRRRLQGGAGAARV